MTKEKEENRAVSFQEKLDFYDKIKYPNNRNNSRN